MEMKVDYQCEKCENKPFANASNLNRHLKKFHGLDLTKLNQSRKSKHFKYICEKCPRNFNNIRHLRYHLKQKHGVTAETSTATVKNSFHCPLSCKFETSSSKDCIDHFLEVHEINVEYQMLEFSDFDSFLKWKTLVEKETKSKYVKDKKYTYKHHSTFKYICHRSGYYINKGKGKRLLKLQGSNKINGYCPAGLVVLIGENKVCNVNYLKTHVGHDHELEHLFLSLEERQLIANKIASKVPFTTILNDVKDCISDSSVERIHLLTRKDLYNIESSFNLSNTAVRHTEDGLKSDSCSQEILEADTADSDDSTLIVLVENINDANDEVIVNDIDITNTSLSETTLEFTSKKKRIQDQFEEMLEQVTCYDELAVFESAIASIHSTLASIKSHYNT